MRLIELRARNLLRLTAVDIRPGKGITPIKGENESGKTSTLDAIWIAIKGKAAAPAQPIKKGMEQATIQAEFGTGGNVELVVTRKFTRTEGNDFTTSLDVRTGAGVKITKSPQAVLDALGSQLGFDPLAFDRASPKDQFDMLRALVPGIDFDAIAKERADAFAERTVLNRQASDAATLAARTQVPEGPAPKRIDVSEKTAQLTAAIDANRALERAQGAVDTKLAEADRILDEAEQLRARAATLETRAGTLRSEASDLVATIAGRERIDVDALRDEIDQAASVNQIAAAHEHRAQQLATSERYAEAAAALTRTIEELDQKKADAIAAAKLPVEGLSLGDGVVTYQGLPFSQAATAIKMRVSITVAMALNPTLKLILVRDGSLLDKKSLQLLADMAAEHGFDVLLETIDTTMPGGFEIVDGSTV